MSSHSRKQRHKRLLRLSLFAALSCGVFVFAAGVFRGPADPKIFSEKMLVWPLAAMGFFAGIYGFRNGRRRHRIMAMTAMAMIVMPLILQKALNSEYTPPPPVYDSGE